MDVKMKKDGKELVRTLTKEEIEWLEQLEWIKKDRAKKDEPRTPIVVTLQARVEIPTSWIDFDRNGDFYLKDDENGSSWFFIGLTRHEGTYLIACDDFGLDDYYDTDEPMIELDDDAEWNDDWGDDDVVKEVNKNGVD